MKGKVWMVGAGPGDPDLITVRGREALAGADVIVYDDSVNPDFLHFARDSAEVLSVGRRPPLQPLARDEIMSLLVGRAHDGKHVVRLLGGDPFVFGPGVQEAEVVAAADVAFEIVPGVTASVAAPAYAGIPVIHPDFARSYAVLEGDAADTAPESLVDWSRLATAVDTLVFVLAPGNLATLVERLVAGGRSPETPAAAISWGTDDRRLTVVGTLADIDARAREAGLPSPAITVVGEVVRLREQLRWYDDRPLHGRRVLLTRTRRGASEVKRVLQVEGAAVIELATQELQDLVAPAIIGRIGDALQDGQYGWAIFSSPRAVEMLFRHLQAQGRDARAFQAQILAAGAGTAQALAERGIVADAVVEEPTAEAILAALRTRRLARQRVLLPRAEESQRDLLRGLRAAGAEVEDVPLYTASLPTEPNRAALALLQRREIDAVIVTSSAAVTSLVQLLGADASPLRDVPVACVGPATAQAAREAGLRVDILAEPATPAGLVRALAAFAARGGFLRAAGSLP